MITLGYLVYDFYIQKMYVKDTSDLAAQMTWHHVVGSASILCGLLAGYSVPGVCNMQQAVEFSTIFINVRSLYEKKDFDLFIPQVCQVCFFISFTVLRVIGMPYGLWCLWYSA